MKIYLNPEYKDHKKLERSILEEFPEISVKSAKYKGGKKKATFVYKETCYKFDNRDDLLLTLKELLDYTARKEKLGEAAAAADEEKILKEKSDKKSKNGKSEEKSKTAKSEEKKDKDTRKKSDKDQGKKGKDSKPPVGKKIAEVILESQTASGKDVLVVLPEETEEHVPTLKEILKSKDYEQIDEAFYEANAFEEREDQDDAEEGSQTGSYEASLPKSKEKDDDEVVADTFDEAENLKALTYEVEDIEEVKESDIMKEMGYTESEPDGSEGRISYDESIPVSEGKNEVEIMEEAYVDLEKSRTNPSETQESDEERAEGNVRPDDLMIELGYVEGEGSVAPDSGTQESKKLEPGEGTHRKAGSVEDRSGNRVPLSHGSNEIVLEVPVEKYNLSDLNIKIKFGHFNEPSSTYETKK